MIWDMIPRYISRYDVKPDQLETPGNYKFSENSPPRCGVLLFFRLCLCTHLGFSSVGSLPSSFCCPSHGHIIGLTVQPANSNLVPLGLGLLPEHVRLFFVSFFIFIFFSFVIFYFFPCLVSFLIPGTWYSLVVARYLIYCCC